MIVIADSSPLIALAVIDKLDMLEKLYQEFYVPAAVFARQDKKCGKQIGS
jgi:predicted nucleic acid-binding protein